MNPDPYERHLVRMAELAAERVALAKLRRHEMVMANPRALKRLAEIEAESQKPKLVKRRRA